MKKTTRIIKLLRDEPYGRNTVKAEGVTDHYESNPNYFTEKRLAEHGGLEEMRRAPEDVNCIINRSLVESIAERHAESEVK